jgi:predicted permease
MRRFLARSLNFLRLTRRDEEATREIAAHLALIQDEYESRGMTPEAARRAAHLAIGGIEQTKERHRDARSFPWLEDARQDVALGLRLLSRSPLFTFTTALSLAIGIGANSAIFTVADTWLFRPPTAVEQPDRLVDIGATRGDGGLNPVPFATYQDIVREVKSLSGVFASEMFPHAMSMRAPGAAETERITGQQVSANFFMVLGSPLHLGRGLTRADEADAATAVVDYDFWARRFERDPQLIGRVLRINDRPVTVVGVAAPGFQGTGVQRRDVWLMLGPTRRASVMLGGRLREGASIAQAALEISAAAALSPPAAGDRPMRLSALPVSRAGGNRNVIAAFAAAVMTLVSMVLGVACANTAGLLSARSHVRRHEMSLRSALGAGRGRLVRQLLTEIVMLFLLGGITGIVLAWGVLAMAPGLSPLPMPDVPLTIDWRVLAFAFSASVLAALVSGLLPALRGSKTAPAMTLQEDPRSSSGRSRARSAFITVQVALSVLLVALGGLFVRALRNAGSADPGFDARSVELTTIDLAMTGAARPAGDDFWRDAVARVRRLPDVEAASVARVPPGGWEGIGLGGVDMPGGASLPNDFSPSWNIVAPGYFETLRIPVLRGRDFAPTDTAGSPPVAIIADAIARRFWPGQGAVGRYLTFSTFDPQASRTEKRPVLVIGVVGDIKSTSLIDGLADPYIYLPVAQTVDPGFTSTMTLITRSRNGTRLQLQVDRAMREIDPDLVAARSETLLEAIALGLGPQRLLAGVAGGLGLIGLALAAIGIHGVMAYAVTQRRREFGIRIALGAPLVGIVWMVLRQGLWIVTAGSVIGLGVATGIGRLLSVFLNGLPAFHLPTFVGILFLVAVVGALACYLPARRAIGREPLRALRSE